MATTKENTEKTWRCAEIRDHITQKTACTKGLKGATLKSNGESASRGATDS